MILHNVDIINEGVKNIHIVDKEIAQITSNNIVDKNGADIYFDNCIAFPGLINSHDHLDFNLFPKLGNCIYEDYVAWGNDIHQQNKEVIASVLKIPKALRTQWGVYKNLINGITTVVQHGEDLKVRGAPINIFTKCHSLHSVQLEKYWKRKLNKPFIKNWPFAMHIGEGTNQAAYNEINDLLRWNLFNRKLIGIHGVAMDKKQAKHFEALIWSPDSNLFLLGKTAAINEIKKETNIIFGTDSTVSANWSVWEQLRIARNTKLLTDEELISSINIAPANIWQLNKTGKIKEGYLADIIIAKISTNDLNYCNHFFKLSAEDILLVICNGSIVLLDESLVPQLPKNITGFNKIYVNNVGKYVIGDLPNLVTEIKKYYPAADFHINIT